MSTVGWSVEVPPKTNLSATEGRNQGAIATQAKDYGTCSAMKGGTDAMKTLISAACARAGVPV
jgi:hypothetical protein